MGPDVDVVVAVHEAIELGLQLCERSTSANRVQEGEQDIVTVCRAQDSSAP